MKNFASFVKLSTEDEKRRGQHCTEVAIVLLTQPPRVCFSSFPIIFHSWLCWDLLMALLWTVGSGLKMEKLQDGTTKSVRQTLLSFSRVLFVDLDYLARGQNSNKEPPRANKKLLVGRLRVWNPTLTKSFFSRRQSKIVCLNCLCDEQFIVKSPVLLNLH